MANKVGRPLNFKSEKELEKKIQAYFDMCDSRMVEEIRGNEVVSVNRPRPKTITGLAVALDTNRQTLLEYQAREKFADTIKRAKAIIEEDCVMNALDGKQDKTMSIFNLKNNYGWKDQSQMDVNATGSLTIESKIPRPKKKK